jgi:beta-glucosidase
MARNSDAVVLVLGGSSARNFDSKFDATGAADLSHGVNEMNCGEGADMASLELEGSQLQLADEVLATGRPVVLVLIQGRPHAIPTLADRCSAILCGWYPGTEGGLAIAEALFGRVNPSGKLPVSIPRSSGQIPVYYNHKASMDRKYIDLEGAPQYPFGHGLSYTEFHYSNIAIETGGRSTADILEGGKVNVSVDVENIGRLEGAEVVQLYLNDLHGSVTTRVKMLRGFRKIFLRPGERRRVYFELGTAELGLWDATMKFTVEPGKFRVMAGGSSNHAVDSFFELPSGGRGLI